MNPFIKCPVYLTDHYRLRKTFSNDTEELLNIYSNQSTVDSMNRDNCDERTCDNIEMMHQRILNWEIEYEQKKSVHWTIIEKVSNLVIASMSLKPANNPMNFLDDDNFTGVLRLDVMSSYESKEFYHEIFQGIKSMISHFNLENIITKCESCNRIRFISLLASDYYCLKENELIPFKDYFIYHY